MTKLSLGTLAWTETDLPRAARAARAFGLDGLDIRVQEDGELRLSSTAADARQARGVLHDHGLRLAGLMGYLQGCAPGTDARQATEREADLLTELACLTEPDAVRIFGAKRDLLDAAPSRQAVLDEVARTVRRMLDGSPGKPFRVLLQHHRLFLGLEDIRHVVREVNNPRAGLVFSPDHCRIEGLDILGHAREFLPLAGQMYLADVTPNGNGAFDHVLPSDGEAQLSECVGIARHSPACLWHSLKWEKRWHPELPPVEEALPRFRRLFTADRTAAPDY